MKVEDLGLTAKEIKFVGEYCTNGSDAVSAIKASKLFPDDASPTLGRLKSLELLNKQNIITAVNRFVSSELDPYRDKLNYQILNSMQARAFYDPDTFFEADGTARPLNQIPPHLRQAIDSVEVKHYGKDGNVLETVYKLADKTQAIKSLRELLDRKAGPDDDSMNTGTRARLNEIFFKAGMMAGHAITEAKEEPLKDATPTSAKEHIASLKSKIRAEDVDAEES
jgi:hypothetical protein